MKKWTEHTKYSFTDELLNHTFTENAIFFDIETTGFSPAYTQLYLIGCARRKGDTVIIEQFFAESKEDEKQILSSFLELLKEYPTIITFNGIGFDIPYLKAKCDAYGLTEDFSSKDYVDIFKIVSSFKFLLKLPNYKQKSLESFLGIHREDTFDGGELVNIYKEYVKNPTEYQMFSLKQHNYEDVLGMLELIPILSYSNFFMGGYSIVSIEGSTSTSMDGDTQKELIFSLKNDVPVPKRVSFGYKDFYLTCHGPDAKIAVRLYDGELKFFFEHYEDYYYLPEEDTAVHKSVASYVDRDYRKKATASTCYTKKTSLFVPQYDAIMSPAFREKYNDKKSYFELSEDFTDSDIMLRRYVTHILKLMMNGKK